MYSQCAQALIHSDSARVDRRENEKAIALSTYGLLFLGTPHQGGHGADIGKVLARVGSLVTYTSPNIIKNLAEHSEWLQQQQGQFSVIGEDFEIKFFYETYKMHIPIYGDVLVVFLSSMSKASYSTVTNGVNRWFRSTLRPSQECQTRRK